MCRLKIGCYLTSILVNLLATIAYANTVTPCLQLGCNPSAPNAWTPRNQAELIHCINEAKPLIDLCGAADLPQTIILKVKDNDVDGHNGLPEIVYAVTIQNGTITTTNNDPISPPSPKFRIFHVSNNGHLSLVNVTLVNGVDISGNGGGAIFVATGGQLDTVLNTFFESNSALFNGGAIFLQGPVTSINGSGFFSNTAGQNGGALYVGPGVTIPTISDTSFSSNHATNGGAIYVAGTGSVTTMSGGTFFNDIADNYGGAILLNDTGSIGSMYTTVFESNKGVLGGGAIYIDDPARLLTMDGCSFLNNFTDSIDTGTNGGAIQLFGSINTIAHTIFSFNSTFQQGGAISVEKTGSIRKLLHDTFNNNNAQNNGGAIDIAGSVNAIQYSQLNANVAGKNGGAIDVEATGFITKEVDSTTLSNNVSTGSGGGLNVEARLISFASLGANVEASLTDPVGTISNSTFNNNVSLTTGGGINVGTGAIIAKIFNDTFNKNVALDSGGAIAIGSSAQITTFDNNTVDGNSTTGEISLGGGIFNCGTMPNFNSNIVAENASKNNINDIDNCSGAGSQGSVKTPASNNLIGANTNNSFIDGKHGNIVGTQTDPVDPDLFPLLNNGGPTFTMALDTDSPAHKTGSNPLQLPFDQRGYPFLRESNGSTDIGAYQIQENRNEELDDEDKGSNTHGGFSSPRRPNFGLLPLAPGFAPLGPVPAAASLVPPPVAPPIAIGESSPENKPQTLDKAAITEQAQINVEDVESKPSALGCSQLPGLGSGSLWPFYVMGLFALERFRNKKKRRTSTK